MNIPPQNLILYTNRCWRPAVDALIMNIALDHYAERTPLPHAMLDDEVLHKVCRDLETTFGRGYTRELIVGRFQFLRDRFVAFKTLVETRSVHWIMRDNSIIVDDYTFRSIVQRNGLSQAYYRQGDPDIVNLRLLFETEELKLTPYHVVPFVDPGSDGCSVSPLSISEDESQYESDYDLDTWSSDDGSSAGGKD